METANLITFHRVDWPQPIPAHLFRYSIFAMHEHVTGPDELLAARARSIRQKASFIHEDWSQLFAPWALVAFPEDIAPAMQSLLQKLIPDLEEYHFYGLQNQVPHFRRQVAEVTSPYSDTDIALVLTSLHTLITQLGEAAAAFYGSPAATTQKLLSTQILEERLTADIRAGNFPENFAHMIEAARKLQNEQK